MSALLIMAASACTAQVLPGRGVAARPEPSSSSTRSTATAAPSIGPAAGRGLVAMPMASSLQVRAEDVRLVRHQNSVALQFEYTNASADKRPAGTLGLIWGTTAVATLFDLPRGAGYRPELAAQPLPWEIIGFDGFARIGPGVFGDIEPGSSAMVTIMFPAPPAETTSMMVAMAAFLPIEVPVQPEGSAALRDDPVLRIPRSTVDFHERVGPIICTTSSKPTAATTSTHSRLPGDVLFASGSAELSPGGAASIEQLATEQTAATGTITIAGHTDSVGDEPASQQLSERRATAVRERLAAKLSSGFTFDVAGFGETKPAAPNTRPDGSDDPDGRAQNRRVEVTIATAANATPGPAPQPLTIHSNLTGAGLLATARPITKLPGTVLAQVQLQNPRSETPSLGYYNDQTSSDRALHDGELRLTDSTGAVYRPCQFAHASAPNVAATDIVVDTAFGSKLPAGATLTMWSLFATPTVDGRSVQVRVGGIADALPTAN